MHTPINSESVQYQYPQTKRLTASSLSNPQRGLHNTHSEAYPDAHSPQRGLGCCTLLLPKHSEGEDILYNTDSVRTSCTLYTLIELNRHTLDMMTHTLEILYRLNTQSKTPNGICGYRVCYAHRRGQSMIGIFWRRRSASTRTSGPGVLVVIGW